MSGKPHNSIYHRAAAEAKAKAESDARAGLSNDHVWEDRPEKVREDPQTGIVITNN